MPNGYIDKVTLNGTTYDIKDTISGYTSNTGTVTSVVTGTGLSGGPITTTGTVSLDTTYALTSAEISAGTSTANKLISAKTLSDALSGFGGGTITGVTAGTGLNGGGTTGTVTLNHSNSITAQTTQALYPIKIDAQGHITSYGTAATIPSVYDGQLDLLVGESRTSSIFTANQSGKSALVVSTSSIGVASGWSAGTIPTLGTAISADDITDWTTNTPTTIDTTKFNGGSFTRGAFSGGSFTQGSDSFTQNIPTKIDTTKFSGGSFTRGAFSGGSFTQGSDSFTKNVPTVVSFSLDGSGASAATATILNISVTAGTSASFTQGTDSFTAATHAADSFTSASLNTGFYTSGTSASFTQGTDSFTAATHAADSFTSATLASGFYSAGTAASLSYTSRSIPNVTSAGTLPSLTTGTQTVVIGLSKGT